MRKHFRVLQLLALAAVAIVVAAVTSAARAPAATTATPSFTGTFKQAVAADVSKPLRVLAQQVVSTEPTDDEDEDGPATDNGFTGDASKVQTTLPSSPTIASPLANFEGISNQDNFNLFGFRVNPPDPVGDVGPNNYVEMANLAFAVYNKAGTLLLGPADTGTLWTDFNADCTEPSGDPIVVYDQVADRWILSQFTTAGPEYFECIAVSTTGDPTGTYYRYAFSTGLNFPDYPKLGIWKDSYILTTREFGPIGDGFPYGIGVYALERNKMLNGQAKARAASFFIEGADAAGNDTALLPLVGDGLLPPDMDGKQKPREDAPAPIVGTQDDGGGYGATFDAINIFNLDVHWNVQPIASLALATQLPTAAFDSIFPCSPTSRDCLPQPGITNSEQYLDILSYRQRPTYRLAYRNFKSYESLVTSQSVEATPGVAGMRWYEVRRNESGTYSLYQQGTFAPSDGIHRWMGSVAQDKKGDVALGYSVVDGTSVFPGIRYTGRLAGDSLGQMTLGEGTIVNGSGVQRTTNSRWGDYTSLNVDPVDDCTFWYVNEYYTLAGQISSTAGWQTRIASFKLPGCS